jgi:hypothetical protein
LQPYAQSRIETLKGTEEWQDGCDCHGSPGGAADLLIFYGADQAYENVL